MSQLAKLRLFNAIEPGSTFWVQELKSSGPEKLIEDIIQNRYQELRKSAERVRERLLSTSVEQIQEEISQAEARFLTDDSLDWPKSLDDLQAPPIGLIVKGEINFGEAISIVGTRNPTTYGARIANEFAAGFADRDWAVISGGAYGIDTHAHRGAIAAEGKTIAVLASGVKNNYPAGNERLFGEIMENGALISEVMPSERARPERFLTRNRLIAALSRGTIVVEAAFRSGSLRTARNAAEIFRTVMAVPGPITSPTSDGCHRLIGERCAEIVTSVADAMELLLPIAPTIDSTLRGDDT